MSATPADDVQTSPAWNCGANIQHFFDMTKHYGKNLKIFADLSVFLVQNVKCRA